MSILLVVVLLVGGITGWYWLIDRAGAQVRGAHRFEPVVPFPDKTTAEFQARVEQPRPDLSLTIGFRRWNDTIVPVTLQRDEFRHMLILGRTGGGKTAGVQTWLLNLLASARASGRPVTVVYCSPHRGDLDTFLPLAAETGLPVASIDLSGTHGITPWSPFVSRRAGASAEEVANRSVRILGAAFSRDFSATPELRQVLLCALYIVIVDPRITLDTVGDVLLDGLKGRYVLPKIRAANIRAALTRLWTMPETQRYQIVRHALPKLGMLTAAETVRWTLNQEPQYHLNLDQFLDQPGIVCFHPATEKVGDVSVIFTTLFLEHLRGRLLARTNPEQKPLVVLVVDELAEVLAAGGSAAAETVKLLLTGSRKTNTILYLCAQDLFGQVRDKQLTSVLLSQTSKAIFQLGRYDAKEFAKELHLPPERPVLWPGDWSCEGSHVGDLNFKKWRGDTTKDRQMNTYLSLISLPPRSFYLQNPIRVDGFVQNQTQLLYTHERPEPQDPRALPTFVGMQPRAAARKAAETRTPPWTPSSPSTTTSPTSSSTSSKRRSTPRPTPGTSRHAVPTTWI